jgi:hypothetical protein
MWDLTRPGFWIIMMRHPTQATTSPLQAEESGVTWMLAFTSETKAVSAIDELGVRDLAQPKRVCAGATLDLMSAVCRTGASGIIVDFDPESRSCACRRLLVVDG